MEQLAAIIHHQSGSCLQCQRLLCYKPETPLPDRPVHLRHAADEKISDVEIISDIGLKACVDHFNLEAANKSSLDPKFNPKPKRPVSGSQWCWQLCPAASRGLRCSLKEPSCAWAMVQTRVAPAPPGFSQERLKATWAAAFPSSQGPEPR